MAAALETASESQLWDPLATGPLKHVQFEGGVAIEGTGAEDRFSAYTSISRLFD